MTQIYIRIVYDSLHRSELHILTYYISHVAPRSAPKIQEYIQYSLLTTKVYFENYTFHKNDLVQSMDFAVSKFF